MDGMGWVTLPSERENSTEIINGDDIERSSA